MTKRYSYFNANMVGQLKRENKKLKDENEQLKKENKELNKLCVKYGFEVGRLEEENEQLKQHNTELINKIDFLERVLDGDVE